MLLVPGDPLRPRRPDPHFAPEAVAARDLGLEVGLVDHDRLVRARTPQDAREAVLRAGAGDDAVYRGWMVTADQYAVLASALAERGTSLRTGAAAYRRAHELPGWHGALAAWTAEACWTQGADLDDFRACLRRLGHGAAVLRDHTKSLKHHWHDATLVPDVTDEERATAVAARFLDLRGDAFDGGLVLRRFEELVGPELRTWWSGGRCGLATAHPDTPDEVPEVPEAFLDELAPAVASLGLPFVTVDVVARADGRWRVVELGDGQVSDRPGSCPPEALVGLLA